MTTNENDVVGSGVTTNVIIGNNNATITIGSNDSSVTIGSGNDTITAGDHDIIAVGNGVNTVTIGSYDTLTVGSGQNTINAGHDDTITVGNGVNTIVALATVTVTAGNGQDSITAGPNSHITAGNGTDTVHVGHDSAVTLGSGPDNVHAGTSDTITTNAKSSKDNIEYDGLTPAFTVPSGLSVSEEQSIALPITLLPPNLGTEVISGFKTANGIIGFDTHDFSNAAAVLGAATQVGANTVITQPGGGGTVTLTNVSLSSLSASNFVFFTGPDDVINITGVPSDATLSAGTRNTDGSWTLTPAQLSGLQLNAGEPIGYPSPDILTVTITNPSGEGASSSQTIPLVVNAIPPTVGVSALAYQTGDPVTETRLELTAATDDPDSGNDYIKSFSLSGIPTGVVLTTGTGAPIPVSGGNATIPISGTPGSVSTELDVFAPAAQTTNFNLGITANSVEPNSPMLSTSTSQNIDVEYSTTSQTPDFTSTNQSIWTSGTAFSKSFDNFLGVDFGPATASKGFTLSIPVIPFVYTVTVGQRFGATASLKAGFQSDLNINGGAFNGQLPFNIGLADTYNKINNALEVDPTDSQAGGGSFTTSSPSGSYELDFILDAFARVFTNGTFGTNSATLLNINTTVPLLHKNSSTLSGSFDLPEGIGSVSFAWPNVATNGSNPGAGTISSNGTSAPIFQISLDPIAIVLDAILGNDPLKGNIGPVNYTILAATVAPGIDLQQSFNLNASLPGGTLTPDGGSGQTFTFGSPIIIPNSDGQFSLTLDPNATLENDTSLAGQLMLGVKAIAGSIKLTISGVGPTIGFGPLIHPTTTLGPATLFSLYNKTFAVTFKPTTLPVTVT